MTARLHIRSREKDGGQPRIGRPVSARVLRFMANGLTYKQAQKKAHALRLIAWRKKNNVKSTQYSLRHRLLRMGAMQNCFRPAQEENRA